MPVDDFTLQQAREYIDAAIATQRRMGYVTPIPDALYERAVRDAARAFHSLAVAAERFKKQQEATP